MADIGIDRQQVLKSCVEQLIMYKSYYNPGSTRKEVAEHCLDRFGESYRFVLYQFKRAVKMNG